MNDDLISVIMTVYNSNADYLREAINSVVQQSYKNYEFIIVDDGSTNDSLGKVISELEINDIKIIKQKNSGLCNARNRGLTEATGKYVAFIDDDDIWYSSKLEECYSFFLNRKKEDRLIGMVFTQSTIIDETNKEYGVFGYKVSGNIYNKILGKNIIGPPSSVFIDKSVLDDIGYFDSNYVYAEDIELWYRLTKKYNVYSLDEPLIKYRYRLNSLSKNYRKMGRYTENALRKAINADHELTNKEQLFARYYTDFAFLYFSNNDKEFFREYYFKAVKSDVKSLLNLKLIFGFMVSLFGERLMRSINNKRRSDDVIPPSYLRIHDYTGANNE